MDTDALCSWALPLQLAKLGLSESSWLHPQNDISNCSLFQSVVRIKFDVCKALSKVPDTKVTLNKCCPSSSFIYLFF